MEHLVSIIFVIAGSISLILTAYLFIRSQSTKIWRVTKGEILGSHVDSIGNDADTSYSAKILYKYTVENEVHYSYRVYFGDFIKKSWSHDAYILTDKYKKNSMVDVYYNPLKPNDSVLETGINKGIWPIPIMGIIFIAIGLIFWFPHS